jgi:predicted nucleic acid-binding protein
MMLLDTSVVIPAVRREGASSLQRLIDALQGEDFAVSRVTEMELLQGARDEIEWSRLQTFLAAQEFVELSIAAWQEAARIRFELRRKGMTISSALDCCIAQSALERDLTLLHNDSDFEAIATIRPLKQLRLRGLEPVVAG